MASLRQLRSSETTRGGWDDVQSWIQMANATFPVQTSNLLGTKDELPSGDDFASIYKSNGIVFACMAIRQRVFSQIVFRFASINNGKVGKLFGSPDLDVLDHPWANGTSGDLATRMILDADTKGAFFGVREADTIYRRDPLKMSVVLSGNPLKDEFVDIMGYVYRPNGKQGPAFTYTPSQVCHWTPVLDPDAAYTKGMSWLTPILREVRSDNSATDHKAQFFKNGATPNMVVKFPEGVMTQDQFDRFKAKMEAEYAGSRGAGKTLYLAPGADVEVVGKDFKEMDFSETQGRDETRIASAAGVPPVLVGLKESLAGSSLNAGNYAAARRSFADATMSDLYRGATSALQTIVPAPQQRGPSKLWFDLSQVPFFREDRGDAATIRSTQASTIKSLIDAGYEPDSVIAAMEAEDFNLLVHSGLYSVQLQPAGTQMQTTPPQRSEERSLEQVVDSIRMALTERPQSQTFIVNPPEVPVTVDARTDVHVPEQREPVVNITNEVDARSETPVVNVTLPEQAAPTVTVTNEVQPTPVEITNEIEVPAAQVVVNTPKRTKTESKVIRDSKNQIVNTVATTEIVEE